MTLILDIQYDGTNLSGWQIQPNAVTVQGELEEALFILTNRKYTAVASGRTDAGVHAFSQIVHIADFKNTNIPENKIVQAINSRLRDDIRVNRAVYYDGEFHSRFDALEREYKYFLTNKYSVFDRMYKSFIKFPIDFQTLEKTSDLFNCKKDYTTFSKFNADQHNPECNVTLCSWEILNDHEASFTIRANHFLYGMVRSVVGASVDVARGKRNHSEIISAFEKKDRNFNSPLAPPQGLYLNRIYYPKDYFGE